MIQDLDELRRRALATGDPADWQRLSLESMRVGLDLQGRPLPEHALQSLRGYGFVIDSPPLSLNYSPSGQFLGCYTQEDVRVWLTESGDSVWQSPTSSRGRLQFDAEDRLFLLSREGSGLTLRRIAMNTQSELDSHDFPGALEIKLSPSGRQMGVLTRAGLKLYECGDRLSETWGIDLEDPLSFQFFSQSSDSMVCDRGRWLRVTAEGELGGEELWGEPSSVWTVGVSGELFIAEGKTLVVLAEGESPRVLCSDPRLANTQRLRISPCGGVLYAAVSTGARGMARGREGSFRAPGFKFFRLLCIDIQSGLVLWQREGPPFALASHPKSARISLAVSWQSAVRSTRQNDGSDWCAGRWPRDKLRRLVFSEDSRRLVVAGESDVLAVLDWAQQRVIESTDGLFEDYDEAGSLTVRRGADYLRGLDGNYDHWRDVDFEDLDRDLETQFHHRMARQFPEHLYDLTILSPGDWDWVQAIIDLDYARFPSGFNDEGRTLRLVRRRLRVGVFDTESESMLWTEDLGILRSASFSHSGRVLWLRYLLDEQRYCARVETETGRVLARVPDIWAEEQRDACNPPDFMTAFSVPGENGYELVLLDSEFRELARFQGHEHKITAIAFANDAGLLATGDEEGSVFVWNTKPTLKKTDQGLS